MPRILNLVGLVISLIAASLMYFSPFTRRRSFRIRSPTPTLNPNLHQSWKSSSVEGLFGQAWANPVGSRVPVTDHCRDNERFLKSNRPPGRMCLENVLMTGATSTGHQQFGF